MPGQSYVALGDSFTSAPLVPVTDVADGCFRSSANYPALVARELGADLEDRSCAGARIEHLTTPERPAVPPQVTALGRSTDLVTVGIGGNDEGVFRQLTRKCPSLRSRAPAGAPCQAFMTSGGRDVLLTALGEMGTKLTSALADVRRRAPQARVLVVGYPQIVSAEHTCAALPLARGDYAYVAKVNMALNDALRKAARATDATYVDVWAASRQHDICSSDPWVNGSVTDQARALAYHPFAAEQRAVAKLVLAAVAG